MLLFGKRQFWCHQFPPLKYSVIIITVCLYKNITFDIFTETHFIRCWWWKSWKYSGSNGFGESSHIPFWGQTNDHEAILIRIVKTEIGNLSTANKNLGTTFLNGFDTVFEHIFFAFSEILQFFCRFEQDGSFRFSLKIVKWTIEHLKNGQGCTDGPRSEPRET